MACLSLIRFTIYENQTRINRSTLDMTRLCCVSLAVQEILRIFHEYYDEISITCAIKKELYALFPALDAAHSRDMSHATEMN